RRARPAWGPLFDPGLRGGRSSTRVGTAATSDTRNPGKEGPAMDRIPRRPSMADVAARAGVSCQTVTRVLNEPQIGRPDTRARVEESIAALGYTRNRAARTLKTTRSSLIGVLTDGSSLFGPAETT